MLKHDLRDMSVNFRGNVLKPSEKVCDLGVILDQTLSFDDHISTICQQGWGQVQLTKYSSTPSTPNIYQVQVLVKYSFFKKVLKYIKYFHIKYKYKYSY